MADVVLELEEPVVVVGPVVVSLFLILSIMLNLLPADNKPFPVSKESFTPSSDESTSWFLRLRTFENILELMIRKIQFKISPCSKSTANSSNFSPKSSNSLSELFANKLYGGAA